MNREQEHGPDMAEQGMGQHNPEDPKAKFEGMVAEGQKQAKDKKGGGDYMPKKVIPKDMEGQREYDQIDHEEVLYHADLAKALQENFARGFAKRVDELPQDIQVDLGVRRSQLEKKIKDFNQRWEGK